LDQQTNQSTDLLKPSPILSAFISSLINVIEEVNNSDLKRMQAILCLSRLIVDSSLMSET
jgi:hypothetical protein